MGRDLYDQVAQLFTPPGPGPYFQAIAWDAERHCLSFLGHDGRYVNVWLNRPAHDPKLPQQTDHYVETNGGPAADSETLWSDGQWSTVEHPVHGPGRRFEPTIPPDVIKKAL